MYPLNTITIVHVPHDGLSLYIPVDQKGFCCTTDNNDIIQIIDKLELSAIEILFLQPSSDDFSLATSLFSEKM